MGNSSSDTTTSESTSSEPVTNKNEPEAKPSEMKQKSENKTEKKEEKKRPCCVCKETRAARDLCFAEKSPNGFEECYKELQQHKECMAKEGFKI